MSEPIEPTPKKAVSVMDATRYRPWPPEGERRDWTIYGVDGTSTSLAHTILLTTSDDDAAVAAYLAAVGALADGRWGTREAFDATRFTDPADDRRAAPAQLIRSLGAEIAWWWRIGLEAVLLVRGTDGRGAATAVALVMHEKWMSPSDPTDPLRAPLTIDFRSSDSSRVMGAVWEVIATRDPAVLAPLAKALPAIERSTGSVELGGMLISNSSNLEHALERIRLFRDGTCLCEAYLDHQRYDPEREQASGHVRIVEEIPVFYNGRPDRPRRICECTDCGKRFEVEEGEYHYTWWKWKTIAKDRLA